ncbi:ATP-binding protein [Mucilaginibacter sp. FT3.2]|uniref:ATP-binding protein n=1 Tax=Mucilaginibacter sp. FT3.2 TaxID=2723090 RepID=UPI0016147FA7|nr:ATP-binding protein [Mucilaginibacter sp. FT3.2]MBB6233934.1 signal transduction histidine kinase/BarA-like signal transduction histidine kinase [Mucilaginibacter sp. FT3.2]
MDKITDRYHQPVNNDRKHLDPLFDFKEVAKRTYQLGFSALSLGIFLSVYDAFIGMYVSSFLLACFCFAILMFMILKHQEAIKDLTISIFSVLCGLLICLVLLEGLQSDQYLYFFPILIAVPLVVDLKQKNSNKPAVFVGIMIFSFITCIVIGNYVKPMEQFTAQQAAKLILVNRFTALGSTIVFAALYTFFEKKYIEEILTQSERVINTKTQFLATMGHELRTPLNGIIGVVSLLKNEQSAAKQEEYIKILQSTADHMLQQVNDILDFNKIEAGKLELHPIKINLDNFLLNTSLPFKVLTANKSVEVQTEVDKQLSTTILADDMRLTQVLNNLFANALKFTTHGYVKLKATCIKKDAKTITAGFSMEDTGIGIDKADQEKIFEGFWQVYHEDTRELAGTGLGLTICNRILRLMGSKLSLESEKGKGSKFYFELTFELAATAPVYNPIMINASSDLKQLRILLVEDNKINMMVAKKVLTGFQASVDSAYDGAEALTSLAHFPHYDIVLMDLEMPVMNGYEAIFEMKEKYPLIPVIAFTASLVDQQMLSDLLASGFNDCLLKPFTPQQLLSVIKKHVGTPQRV